MISIIIYLILFGPNFFNIVVDSYHAMVMNCDLYQMYNFFDKEGCEKVKQIGYNTFMYFIAMNILGFLDVGGYLTIVYKITNPFILRNTTMAIILDDKLKIVKVHNPNLFTADKRLYYVRGFFTDIKRNNKIMLYLKEYCEPLFFERRERVNLLLSAKDIKESKIKAKGIKQFNIFKKDHYKRHWLMIVDLDQKTLTVNSVNKSAFDPNLPTYRFGCFKKMQIQIIGKQESEISLDGGVSTSKALTLDVNALMQTLKVNNSLGNSAIFNYEVLRQLKNIDREIKYMFSVNPMIIVMIAGIGISILLGLLFSGAIPTHPINK